MEDGEAMTWVGPMYRCGDAEGSQVVHTTLMMLRMLMMRMVAVGVFRTCPGATGPGASEPPRRCRPLPGPRITCRVCVMILGLRGRRLARSTSHMDTCHWNGQRQCVAGFVAARRWRVEGLASRWKGLARGKPEIQNSRGLEEAGWVPLAQLHRSRVPYLATIHIKTAILLVLQSREIVRGLRLCRRVGDACGKSHHARGAPHQKVQMAS
jgi:hypothetical protein